MNQLTERLDAIRKSSGFIAALDQSGGSTPKALKMYGVHETEYTDDEEMFHKVHEMRTRIITNENFTSDKIMGAILFENTMDREVSGKPAARFLWEEKGIVPILKVDKGLEEVNNGVQIMKPMPELDILLNRALENGVFGTKMRSVIKTNNIDGIKQLVAQQFAIGKQIIAKGLIPIIEPEVDIHSTQKSDAEKTLLAELMENLGQLHVGQMVIFKLTLPEIPNFYRPCIEHDNVLKVVALSGGYTREEANRRLSQNNDMIASFSRALTEGLNKNQSNEEFSFVLGQSINTIVSASRT